MKKITTTFLLLALAMLLPMKTMAEDYYLHYATGGAWGPVENGQLQQVDGKYEVTFTIPAANTSNFYFCVFKSSNSQDWGNGLHPEPIGDEGDNTNMSGSFNAEKKKAWLWNKSSSTDITLKLVCDINNNSWTLTNLSDGQGGGDDDDTPVVPIDTEYGSSSNGKSYYLVSVGHDSGENSTDNIFAEEETATMDDSHKVNYHRILRFNDNANGEYTLAIPATITGKVYIEEVPKSTEASVFYGPSIDNTAINNQISMEAIGDLTPATLENDANVWALTDRDKEDGLYIITIRLDKEGNPKDWSFDYDANRRVAYFLSTANMSSAYAVYDNRTGRQLEFENYFKGYNYFDADPDTRYYVISNIVKGSDDNYVKSANQFTLDGKAEANRDSGNGDILPTINKLFLLGNGGYGFSSQYNQFSPNEKPMQTSTSLQGLCQVEWDPSRGNYDGAVATSHYGIRGQIIVQSNVSETISMAIVGPLFDKSIKDDGTWDYGYLSTNDTDTDAPNNVMKYNDTKHCFEIEIETTDEQNMKDFVFVANQSANSIWYDFNRTARNPYYGPYDIKTSAATLQDANHVTNGTSEDKENKYIQFNRPAGKWTISFYFVTNSSDANKTEYFYTISSAENITQDVPVATVGTEKMIIRTFSYAADLKPLDEKVHIYVAHEFKKNEEKEEITKTITGNVNLYEINYVPAGEGVVLLYTGEPDADANSVKLNFTLANEYNVDNYKESLTDKTYLRKYYDRHLSESWNNDLVGTLENTPVFRSDMDKDGNIIARNFCLSLYSKSKTGKAQGVTAEDTRNYLGFFRFEGTSKANYAYLKYNDDLTGIGGDAQLLHQIMESENPESRSKMAIIFEGFNDDTLGEVTGIKDLEVEKKPGDGYYYNLQGIRVNTPANGGIYIHNGKKIIVK